MYFQISLYTFIWYLPEYYKSGNTKNWWFFPPRLLSWSHVTFCPLNKATKKEETVLFISFTFPTISVFLQGLVTCIRFTWVLVRMHIHRPDTRPVGSEFGGRAQESAVLFLSCAKLFLCLGLNFQSLLGYAHLNVFSSHTYTTHPKLNHPWLFPILYSC